MAAFIPVGPCRPNASEAAAATADPSGSKPKVKAARRNVNGLERGRTAILALIALTVGTMGYLSAYSIYKDQQKLALKVPPPRRKPNLAKRAVTPPGGVPVPWDSPANVAPAPPTPQPKNVMGPAMVNPPAPPTEPKVMTSDQIIAKLEPSVAVIRGFEAQGAGFVVAPGLVATNAHLIRRSLPTTIKVSFPAGPPGRQGPFSAEVLHFDDGRNLAILEVPVQAPPIPVAKDYALRRGEDVVYIGGPRPNGRSTKCFVARGMLGADVRIDDRDYYELAGSVSPCHSGAPVIDFQGRVVAVLSSQAPGEGMGLCIPARDLAEAIGVVSAGNPARVAEAKKRHEASVRLSSTVIRNGIAVDGRGDRTLNDFLKGTGPATWLASVDANSYYKNSDPAVAPVRDRVKQVKVFYTEREETIAASTIQSVGKIRDAGMSASCVSFLDAAMTWAPEAVLKASRTRSILTFGEAYVGLRVNDRLGHAEALDRMRNDPSSLPPGLARPAPAASKGHGPGTASARLDAAMRLENEGKTEAAIAAFQSILENYPRTMESGMAQARLNVLRPSKKPPSDPTPGRSAPRG